jgi:hypothetical protein
MPDPAASPAPSSSASAQPGVFIDPYRSYNFKLVVQGVVPATTRTPACEDHSGNLC